jgi:phosphoglucosamine mutase
MKKEEKLFGTDGIRGTANQYPMVPETVCRIGQAIGYTLQQTARNSTSPLQKGRDRKRHSALWLHD